MASARFDPDQAVVHQDLMRRRDGGTVGLPRRSNGRTIIATNR
jgi:hypothetical protein